MTKQRLYVQPSNPEEKGPFSDTTSHATYQNVSNLQADAAIRAADDRAIDVRDTGDVDSDDPDQRYNLYLADVDGEGTDTPARYRVGGV